MTPIAVRIGSELSGATVGNDSFGITGIEVMSMVVEFGIDSSTCDGSVGISAETRSDGEMFVVRVGKSVNDWIAVNPRSTEVVLLTTSSNVELIDPSSLEGTSSMVEVEAKSELIGVIEAKSVLVDSSSTTDTTGVENRSLASVVVAGSSINEDTGLSPPAMVVKVSGV